MLKGFTNGIIDPTSKTVRKALRNLRDIENAFKEKVYPVPGSVVLCDLVANEYHSGIYIGNNRIVHLEGSGEICSVSPERFLKRLGGLTGANVIFVSCDIDGDPVGDAETAERALSMVGKSREYNLFFDNCHQFTSGCITGDFDNSDNFTWMLKMTVEKYMGAEKWLLWKGYDKDISNISDSLRDMLIIR
jgi:hypothetical protein